MRKFTAGNGSDSTSAVQAWLASHSQLWFADLILIGEPEYPDSIWLTNWESPLAWPVMGKFLPASISRVQMKTSTGLEVANSQLTYSPKNRTFTNSSNPSAATSPIQLAQLGYYDNWNVRVWRTLMPTPGDANTFGATEWFGGRVASSSVDRGKIVWQVNSFLEVVDQMVPNNVIENTNIQAGYIGSSPTPGDAAKAVFNVINGSTQILIIGDATYPSTHKIYGAHSLQGGYLVFLGGPNATLGGFVSAIADNTEVNIGGVNYNQIQIFSAMPWAPTPGSDTFYVSSKSPVDQSEAATGDWFPYVPSPESAVSGT